jgi:hypothetical protein
MPHKPLPKSAYIGVDNDLPCKNPNCSQCGKPHIGCKCFSSKGGYVGDIGLAKGGEVTAAPPAFEDTTPVEQPTQATTDAPPAFEDTTPVAEASPPAFEDTTPVTDYGSPEQQFKTVAEGAAQGIAGPLATLAETKILGVDPADIAGRAETNPMEHGVSEAAGLIGAPFIPGLGEYSLGAKAAEAAGAVSEVAKMSKLGSAAIKGAVTSGLIQGSDEVSKYLLGQNNDPTTAGAAILSAGALGGVGGGLFGLAGSAGKKALEEAANEKLGNKALNFLVGSAIEANPANSTVANDIIDPKKLIVSKDIIKASYPAFKAGQKFWQKLTTIPTATGQVYSLAKGYEGYKENGLIGAAKGYGTAVAEVFAFKTLGTAGIKYLNKYTAPALLGALQNQRIGNLAHTLNMSDGMQKGLSSIGKGVENLFQTSAQQGVNAVATEKEREKLNQFIKNGGVNKQIQNQLQQPPQVQSFSDGGLVDSSLDVKHFSKSVPSKTSPTRNNPSNTENSNIPFKNSNINNSSYNQYTTPDVGQALNKPVLEDTDFMSTHYPELGTMLGAAKTRIGGYLNTMRPQENIPKLPFDAPLSQTAQQRNYNRALDMAIQPLSILNHVKDGTLTPDRLQHFTSMYPELHDHLKSEITKKILDAQMNGEKPSFTVRKGLSMFMGSPMDSTLTPQSIQAAQGVFMAQSQAQAQQAPPVKNKKGTSSLSKISKQFETGDQARESRARE